MPAETNEKDDFKSYLEIALAVVSLTGTVIALTDRFSDSQRWLIGAGSLVVAFLAFRLYRRPRPSFIRYPGRLALTAEEFEGRETNVRELLEEIDQHRAVYLVGESGCGKTTLVNWGLLDEKYLLKDRYRIIKIDSYGTDWVRGPLFAVLRQTRTKPQDEDDISGAISRLRKALSEASRADSEANSNSASPAEGKPTLLVFDQFDHYLVAARKHLLRPTAAVIDERSLRSANPFWECILQLAEDGIVKCLFVVETSQYPFTQPFSESRSPYPLRGLPQNLVSARDLLEKRLREAGSRIDSQVVGLLDQLGKDLGQPRILPVQLDFVLRSFPALKAPALKPNLTTYRRLGGLPGLTALGVRSQVQEAAEDLGFSYSEALLILLQLIAEGEGKPQARSAQDLAEQAGGGHSAEEIETLLKELAKPQRRITKQQGDLTGSTVWTLYHELLAGVLMKLREASHHEETRLQQAYEEWRQEKRRLKAFRLASFWSAGRRLAQSLRGRPIAREMKPFLLWSFATVPVLLLLAAAGSYAAFRELQARRLGNEVVQRFDEDPRLLTQEEETVLWLLHGASQLVQRRVLETFLSNDTTAKRFIAHSPLILQSIRGLQPDRTADMLESVWDKECSEELHNLGSPQLQACAVIEDELPTSKGEAWSDYFEGGVSGVHLVRLFARLGPSGQEEALVQIKQAIQSSKYPSSFGGLAAEYLSRAAPEARQRRGGELIAALAAIQPTSAIEALRSFRSALRVPSSELESDLKSSLERLVRAPRKPDENLAWARAVADLQSDGWQLPAELKLEAKNVLLAALQSELTPYERMEVLGDLAPFRNELNATEAAAARSAFIAFLGSCDARCSSLDLRRLTWFFDALDSREAETVLAVLRDNFLRLSSGSPEDLRRSLRALGKRIDRSEMPALLQSYRERLLAADNLDRALPYLAFLGNIDAGNPAAAGDPRADLAGEVLRLIEAEQARGTVSVQRLQTIVPSLWPDWNVADRRRVERALSGLYRQYLFDKENQYWAEALAKLLEQLQIVLPAEEARAPLEQLLDKNQFPCAALAPLVTNDTLPRVVEKAFQYPVCPLGVSPEVIEKLERLNALRVEAVGERNGGDPILDRAKLAAWAREKGYDLEKSQPNKKVSY